MTKWQLWAPPLAVFALFIAGWYFVSTVVLADRQQFLLPTPHRVMAEGFLDSSNRREILAGLWSTTKVALTGFFVATVVGIGFAVLMRQARFIEQAVYPYMVVIDTIPTLALVPLFGFWFGFGFQARVTVSVMVSLFPITSNTLTGLRSIDRGCADLLRLHRAGRLSRLRRLELPGSLPYIFAGMRIGAPLAVIAAIVSDFFFRQGDPGIGRLISVYRRQLDTEELISAVVLASLLGLLLFGIVSWIANRSTSSWYESTTGERDTT